MTICCDCKGEVLHGAALHASKVSMTDHNGTRRWTEYRCDDCAKRYAREWWDEEEQGPYPVALHDPPRMRS